MARPRYSIKEVRRKGGTLKGWYCISWMQGNTMLNRLTSLAEVGNVAAFMASDQASAMTASAANLTCGAVTY